MDLFPALRVERGLLRISIAATRLGEMRQLFVDLARPAARLFASEAQTGIDCDPVKPGRKGAVSPEALHICPDPDPDLLAGVLGLLAHEGRVGADQLRERVDVAAGGA